MGAVNERIWMRGRALAVIAKRNDKMVHVAAPFIIIFVNHGVPSTHPGRVISSITAVITANAQPIGVVYLHSPGVEMTETANARHRFAAEK